MEDYHIKAVPVRSFCLPNPLVRRPHPGPEACLDQNIHGFILLFGHRRYLLIWAHTRCRRSYAAARFTQMQPSPWHVGHPTGCVSLEKNGGSKNPRPSQFGQGTNSACTQSSTYLHTPFSPLILLVILALKALSP